MKILKNIGFWVVLCLVFSYTSCKNSSESESLVQSPDKNIELRFISKNGEIFYNVTKEGKPILLDSKLGFTFSNNDDFSKNFTVIKTDTSSYDETWEQVWGEQRLTRNHYCELKVYLQETAEPKRLLNIIFRVFNDGYGFRYEFPEQDSLDKFEIIDEQTTFNFPASAKAWWIPAYKETYYESLARYTSFAEMDTVTTPVTIELPS